MLKCWALDPNDRPKFHELVALIEYEEVDVIENVNTISLTNGLEERRRRRGGRKYRFRFF